MRIGTDIASVTVPDDAFASRIDCAFYLGIGPIAWDNLVRKGDAPKPTTYHGRSPQWNVGEVRGWAIRVGRAKPVEPAEEEPQLPAGAPIDQLGADIAKAIANYITKMVGASSGK